MSRILVTGANGELGQHLVERLMSRQHSVLAMISEGAEVDVPSGVDVLGADVRIRNDVDKAVRMVDAVVHLATDPLRRTVDFDGTTNVAYACTETETPMTYVSVVGSDKSRFPYYKVKSRAERGLGDIPGLGFTVQRSTQFYSAIHRFLKLPVVPLPGDAPFQPVDPLDLAARLVGLVEAGPSGRVEDFAGPTVMTIDDMAEVCREVTGSVGRTIAVPKFGVMREALDGIFVPAECDTGHRTYRDWLTRR